jgi:replicative DNA helicase
MLGRNIALREFSAANNMNIRYLQSAKDDGMPPLTNGDFDKLKAYAAANSSREEFIIDKALTVNEMQSAIIQFYKKVGKPFVITLDHTLLVKQSGSEKSKQETLNNLSVMMAEMKNKIPVLFLILTQLNREIDDAERQKPGQAGNYPTEKDVFGSDALLQCADVMIAYNRPAKYNLSYYGPHQYMITPTDKYLLAMHVLKNRYGEVGIQWYRADYARMLVVEAPEPSCRIIRKSI